MGDTQTNRIDSSQAGVGKPQVEEIGETGAVIRIEQMGNRDVMVSVTYPEEKRRKGLLALRIVSICLCVALVVVWLFELRSSTKWPVVIGAACCAGLIWLWLVVQFAMTTKSYVLRADHMGLTLETSGGKQRNSQYWVRGQINDIVLGFSTSRGSSSGFQSWLEIRTTSSKMRCMRDLGGDHLARIANALRAALGMPARSWP